MKRPMLTAGALAAALAVGAPSAPAADLDYGRVPTDRYSQAYEDPRYRDLYAPEPHRYSEPQRYAEPRTYYRGEPPPPVPQAYVYRDTDSRGHRYGGAPAEDWRYSQGCLPREEIRRRLVSEGWRDFQELELRQNVAKLTARRPSGDLYDIKIDRCTGDIVHSQLIQRGGYGPYASDNGPRRYDRPYY